MREGERERGRIKREGLEKRKEDTRKRDLWGGVVVQLILLLIRKIPEINKTWTETETERKGEREVGNTVKSDREKKENF